MIDTLRRSRLADSLARGPMPINIALLTASGLGTTKNDVLGKLYGEVLEYNGIAQPLTPITTICKVCTGRRS